jgi:hypothetical protein
VAGTPYGALPEIITPEVGRLSIKVDELARTVCEPEKFDPVACRGRVLHGGFTLLDSAKGYVGFYERILAQGSLVAPGEPLPATKAGFVAKHLLPWEE